MNLRQIPNIESGIDSRMSDLEPRVALGAVAGTRSPATFLSK